MRILKKPQAYSEHLQLLERGHMGELVDLHGKPKPEFEQITVTFLCPPGFEPAAFLIAALNKEGQSFTNAPTEQPALTLRLATLALDFDSQHAIVKMQAQSTIIKPPPGPIPTFPGPEGRG